MNSCFVYSPSSSLMSNMAEAPPDCAKAALVVKSQPPRVQRATESDNCKGEQEEWQWVEGTKKSNRRKEVKMEIEKNLWSWGGTAVYRVRKDSRGFDTIFRVLRQERAESCSDAVVSIGFLTVDPVVHLDLQITKQCTHGGESSLTREIHEWHARQDYD